MKFTTAGRTGFYKGGHYFTIEYGPPGRSIWSPDTFLGGTLFDMTPATPNVLNNAVERLPERVLHTHQNETRPLNHLLCQLQWLPFCESLDVV